MKNFNRAIDSEREKMYGDDRKGWDGAWIDEQRKGKGGRANIGSETEA